MVASVLSASADGVLPLGDERFLALLPTIERHARRFFRRFRGHRAEELVQETTALAWDWYRRLVARGKDPAAFPATLARFAARHAGAGRRLCGQESSHDVLSPRAQQRHGFGVERLRLHPRADELPWREALTDNTQTPPPDAAAFRIDFPRWLATLSERDRRLVGAMLHGDRTGELAKRFGLSGARISQLRRAYHRAWHRFHGELEPAV